jgi:RES domain-containing protein
MRVWRLVGRRHVATAMSGEGAFRFGGRWNERGVRLVYTADSLALATLEIAVHLVGARAPYVAIELDVPDQHVEVLDPADLSRRWVTSLSATARAGGQWVASGRSVGLAVPSALVDARSGERNVLLAPDHPAMAEVRQVQRFEVVLDERL